jgi:Domain of unknown function (DUF4190)
MPVSLTCACGARLEIDDKFAGQTVYCPDCQRALQAPQSSPENKHSATLRTSGFALASLTLALVGAFTLLGTVAAVVLGVIALAQIARQSDRVAGKGYAIAGIVVGLVMTSGTILALQNIELFALSNVINDAQWTGKLEYGGSLEVERAGFSIKRPSDRWGVYKRESKPGSYQQYTSAELVLVLASEDIAVLCFTETVSQDWSLETCRQEAEAKLRKNYYDGLFKKNTATEGDSMGVPKTKRPTDRKPEMPGVDWVEMEVDKKVGNEVKTLLIHVYKPKDRNTMFIVVGATRKGNFERVQPQIREVMNSFKILNRPQ